MVVWETASFEEGLGGEGERHRGDPWRRERHEKNRICGGWWRISPDLWWLVVAGERALTTFEVFVFSPLKTTEHFQT